MKSENGKVILKVLRKSSGEYELIKDSTIAGIVVAVRDDDGHLVRFR